MTKRTLTISFLAAGIVYLIAVVVGIGFRWCDNADESRYYETFVDMIPLIIALPAVWLGHCLQRRSSYLQQLRILWSQLVNAVQESMIYARIAEPTEEQHLAVLAKLAVAIDEVRGVFTNLKNPHGVRSLYPFEPIKNIYFLVLDLGCNTPSKSDRKKTEDEIFALWREARDELLKEFDRDAPTFPHSHWAEPTKSKVYDHYGIEKRET